LVRVDYHDGQVSGRKGCHSGAAPVRRRRRGTT
jgi:hypothetical protein